MPEEQQPRNTTRADIVMSDGFALEVDGRMKTQFSTKAEAEESALNLKSAYPMLQIKVYAGWMAGQIVRGTGFGIVGDLLIGIVGAFIGSWLLPEIGLHLGTGLISAIISAMIGAILLLLVIRLVRGRGGWGDRWGRSWW